MTFFRATFCALFLFLSLVGCQTQVHYHGKLAPAEQLKKIKIGKHTKHDVLDLLGSPTAMSDYGQDTWLYVSKTTETTAFFAPKLVDQTVSIITFTKEGVVQATAMKDAKDAEDVLLSERLTSTAGHRDSAWKQLFGNFGRTAKKER